MGEHDDDWEPLPSDQIGLHPGERIDLDAPGAATEATAAKREPEPVPEPESEPEPEPEWMVREREAADAALAALQRRIDAAPPKESLVKELQRREAKQRRRSRAATARKLQSCKVVTSVVEAADVPLPIVYAKGAQSRDPREDEDWFLELPEREQRRLHDVWAADRAREGMAGRWNPKKANRAMSNGAMVGVGIGLLLCLIGGSLVQAGALALLGAAGSGVALTFGGGRHAFALVGIGIFPVVYISQMTCNPYLMLGWMMTAYSFGAVGMEVEMQKSGGFDTEQPPPV